MKFTLTIPKDKIKAEYQTILNQAASKTDLKGFRPGKAPLDMVEKQLDQAKIQEEIINRLIPTIYIDHIKANKLEPLGQPKIVPQSLAHGSDWTLEVEIAEAPQVKLNDYQKSIKTKVKKPKTKPKNEKSKREQEDQLLTKIFDLLLKVCHVDISPLLVEQETNQRLSQLLDQVDKLGITIEDYASSQNKKVADIRKEYESAAQDRLKLEFILEDIAKQQKLNATDKELDEFISKIEDKDAKKRIQSNQNQQDQIKYSLTRKKVIDYLIGLVS